MKHLIPFCFLIVFFAACNNETKTDNTTAEEPTRDTVNYRALIDESNKQFTEVALKGDSAAFVSLYHPDANIFPPNEEAMDSKKMASMISQFPKMGISAFTLSAKEIYEGNEIVTEVGTFEMGDGKKTVDKGKYIVVWKKDGDKWKMYRDIWNSDNPINPPAKK